LLKLVYLDNTVSVEQILQAFKDKNFENGQPSAPTSAQHDATEALKKKIDLTGMPNSVVVQVEPDSPDACEVTTAAQSNNAGPQSAGDPLSQWPSFLELLQRERPMLGHYLRVAYVTAHNGNSVDVRFPYSCQAQYSEVIKKKNREEIDRVMKKFTGALEDIHLTIEAKPENFHEPGPVQTASSASLSINDEIQREPIIQNILDIFKGDIIN
ncbi:MAG TPA: hypothetical protein VF335_06805, partial [Chitinivibrionales bacterium]